MADEAEPVDTGGKANHLENALSSDEISSIPSIVANKINVYIDKTFEEYLTSKALHETSRSNIGDQKTQLETTILEITAKYEECKGRAEAAESTNAELQKQVFDLNTELEKARDKIFKLEHEIASMKSARDSAVDERNDLTRILQRRDTEIERLSANETALSVQLRAAIDAKCQALTQTDEIQSKELSLQYREKRIEQERVLLNSQIAGLTEEVNRLTSELQTVRLNNTSRLVSLESQVAEKVEELNSANNTIEQLNELKKNLNGRAENLAQRLLEQREIENKISENYKKELEAKTKLADLFKSMNDDSEAKTTELSEGITELQKLLNEASEKYGELETKYKQAETDHEEILEKKTEIISSLKNELEHANDLIKAANAHNLDMALSDLAPSAAAASKLLKSGMSLTQVYSQLVKVSDDLAHEKEENRRLNITINTIVQELEEKAPLLQKQRSEYEEAMENNMAMTQQLESVVMECNRLRDDHAESTKIANHYNRDNARLKGELADLGRQVCFLLKEIEQSRGSGLANGDHDSSHTTSNNSSELSSSRIISKSLVTFSDIQELQSNNQKLLRMVRDLTEKQEECDRHREQIESGEMQSKLETLTNRVRELTEAQDRQTKMVNGLIRQRDMYKKLYHDLMGQKQNTSGSENAESVNNESSPMDTSELNESGRKTRDANEATNTEVKLKETEKQLELLKEEYKTYKEEKLTNERMLFEQIDSMRQEIGKLTASNSKCSSTAEYSNERLKILQTNIATYKKQIASLEEKNKVYSSTIAKHEVSLQHMRDEALNAQSKLATAEVTVENLKMECKLLKDTESRLQIERDMINRERQGQALLLNNLEMIKASLERSETEGRVRIESRLDEATRECAALRRRLQEEQDRFRELASHLERQTDTAKSRMQEEKNDADGMRAELTQLRNDLIEKSKANEELTKKLKIALTPNRSDGTFDSLKKVKDLENQLSEKQTEIQALQDQISVSKEHLKQYCDISESAEKELKTLNDEYTSYKELTQVKLADYEKRLEHLTEKCSELEAELSLQSNGQHTGTYNLKTELSSTKEELKSTLASLESCKAELDLTRAEMTKLSEAVQLAEDKYAHEMVLHSADIQAMSQAKEELSKVQQQVNEVLSSKDQAVLQMEGQKSSWVERERLITAEKDELMSRLDDLNKQNAVLHDQIQALGTQLSVAHASKSMTDSINESGGDSMLNISVGDGDDNKSSEQLFQIIKYLRKEKDIAMAKYDILQAESARVKSQLEITEKKLDDTKITLAKEREKSEVSMVTLTKQSDILRKVETLNALTDSNRILREERDSLQARVEEITLRTRALEEQMSPLQEQISELKSKNESLQSENASLKADTARWRTRVNALVERANKTSPEDWKRLQAEREKLAQMLTSEKETTKKLMDEIALMKAERLKLEEQYSALSRQHNQLVEEHKKVNEELNQLKNDISRITEDLTSTKSELNTTSDNLTKLTEELNSKEANLTDIRNKEVQIRKIAKKYKAQYEELTKSVEEDKKKNEGAQAATEAATSENLRKTEERLAELEMQLASEKAEKEKIMSELETLRSANNDKEEKAKQVLKQAKIKIMQLTDSKSKLNCTLEEYRSKVEALEQSTRDEQDVRLAAIRSQYEGRLSRLEKERSEAQAERSRELDALQQKCILLQRQLVSQAASGKQQPASEKPASDPPTANIKPMAGVAQQSVSGSRRGGETPLASIRPMAQVGPTAPAPHDAHSTEYMPASSSRPIPRASVTASAAAPPPESTQDMDTSEASLGPAATSDSTAQTSTSSCSSQLPQQAVALVMPRIEPPAASSAVTATAAVSASSGTVTASVSASLSAPQSVGSVVSDGGRAEGSAPQPSNGGGGVSTSHAPAERAAKRPRPAHRPHHPQAKRTRHQEGFERSVDIEYQVPTSSRCDQEDEGVIVVDSEEDDDRCTGTTYQEGEEGEEGEGEGMEEEEEDVDEEVEAEEEEDDEDAVDDESAPNTGQESEAQSPEAGGGEAEAGSGAEAAGAEPPPHQQIEAISSGTEPSGALGLAAGGADDGDDSIVPSTPTLYVPRRADGFCEAVVSPVGGVPGARFTFSEAGGAGGAPSHHDTHADLAAALPPPPPAAVVAAAAASPRGAGVSDEAVAAEEESAAVSSQGSQPPSPHQIEEGREAEASASPSRGGPRRRASGAFRSTPPVHHRWSAPGGGGDSGEGLQRGGRGARTPRGRGMRRPHTWRY